MNTEIETERVAPQAPTAQTHMLLALAAQDALQPRRAASLVTFCAQCGNAEARPRVAASSRGHLEVAFAQIRPHLKSEDEAYARLILEQSPEAQQAPLMVVTICRLLRALEPEKVSVGSIYLRTLLEQLCTNELHVGRLMHAWLDKTDRRLRDVIVELVQHEGEELIRRNYDESARRRRIPPEFWWEYPCDTFYSTARRA